MIDRDYVLNLIKSKDVTIEEFNYDKLKAPPIGYFFNEFDLRRLYEIATSLRYSAKPQVRYQEIDNIMKSRGFVKLSAGTNRVVYKCIEDDTFVAKVASDAVGINDNPKEFVNQFYLKPFCAKTFEVSPNGVMAFSERLNPITNREEFLSVAEDIFTLITEFIIGEGVMDDIGTKYFMNYGFRRGFGPAVLDYSTYYKLDGNKLYCNKPDNNKIEGQCLGLIDYDAGYNNLVCTRCGKVYRAHELELKIKDNQIVKSSFKGESKMKLKLSGGSKDYDVTSTINTTVVENSTPAPSEETVYTDKVNVVRVSLGNKSKAPEVIDHKKKEEKKTEVIESVAAVVEEDVTEEEPKVETTPIVEEEKKAIRTPISIGDSVKKTNEEIIRDMLFDSAKFISSKQISEETISHDIIQGALDGIKLIIDTLRSTSLWDITSDENKLLDTVIDDDHLMFETSSSTDEDGITVTTVVKSAIAVLSSFDFLIPAEVKEENLEEDVQPAEEIETTEPEAATTQEETAVVEDGPNETFDDYDEFEVDEYEDYQIPITGYEAFSAKVIDISTKLPTLDSKEVIVIEDTNGEYLTVGDGDKLLVIDKINEYNVGDISVVSKTYITNIAEAVNEKAEELKEDTFIEAPVVESTVNGVEE